jgi:hypothetical protein
MTEHLQGLRFTLLIALLIGAASSARARQEPPSFRPYILKAVEMLASQRPRGGYDLHRRFTRDLSYGHECCLRATPPDNPSGPRPTMCVAAVVEVIVEALNEYARTGGVDFNRELPLARWNGSTRAHVIPNIFQYAGADSTGTAFALERFGLGRERDFQQLLPGDFINFNRRPRPGRTATGHAVVFLGFLRRGFTTPATAFSGDVVGFRYFSAQGQGRADGGFGYRNAYFVDQCPSPRGRDDDCNIVGLTVRANGTVVQTQRLFNTGEMFAPPGWHTAEALARLRQAVSRGFEVAGFTSGTGLEDLVEAILSQPLQPDTSRFVDGSGDDVPDH